jgi:DNA helicase-2/ATP-dependent DNA helicase PcrA
MGPPHRDDDYLFLSTIHSAKGQEWKNVFVLNVVDGGIPACLGAGERKEIEEERRLLCVAMTRAKDSLHLLLPQRFYVENQIGRGDRHGYALRTRFIPDHALGHFKQTTWPEARANATAEARPRATIDLRARMRGAWS